MTNTYQTIADNLANGSAKLTDDSLINYVEVQQTKVLNELHMGRVPGIYAIYFQAGLLAMKLRGLI